jgi:ADP-ribose pyrophosphatase YjhB (NUDIX family)
LAGVADLAQWWSRDEIAALDSVSLAGTALGLAHAPGRALPARRPAARVATALDTAPALVVHAVLSRPDGRVLLVRRWSAEGGSWDLPGGPTEHGESLAVALSRLLAAAAGLEVRGGGILTAGLDDLDRTAAMRITCSASTDAERPPERPDPRWCTPDELAATPLVPGARDALRWCVTLP